MYRMGIRVLVLVALSTVFLGATALGQPDEPSSQETVQLAGATSLEAAVTGAVTAAQAGDLDTLATFLMSATACAVAPEDQREGCIEYVTAIHAMLPEIASEIPQGFEMTDFEILSTMPVQEGVTIYDVILYDRREDERSIGLMVQEIGSRFYVAVPMPAPDEGPE